MFQQIFLPKHLPTDPGIWLCLGQGGKSWTWGCLSLPRAWQTQAMEVSQDLRSSERKLTAPPHVWTLLFPFKWREVFYHRAHFRRIAMAWAPWVHFGVMVSLRLVSLWICSLMKKWNPNTKPNTTLHYSSMEEAKLEWCAFLSLFLPAFCSQVVPARSRP